MTFLARDDAPLDSYSDAIDHLQNINYDKLIKLLPSLQKNSPEHRAFAIHLIASQMADDLTYTFLSFSVEHGLLDFVQALFPRRRILLSHFTFARESASFGKHQEILSYLDRFNPLTTHQGIAPFLAALSKQSSPLQRIKKGKVQVIYKQVANDLYIDFQKHGDPQIASIFSSSDTDLNRPSSVKEIQVTQEEYLEAFLPIILSLPDLFYSRILPPWIGGSDEERVTSFYHLMVRALRQFDCVEIGTLVEKLSDGFEESERKYAIKLLLLLAKNQIDNLLHSSCKHGLLDLVEEIYSHSNPSVDSLSLSYAWKKKHFSIISYLITHQTKKLLDSHLSYLLQKATEESQPQILKLLLQHGAIKDKMLHDPIEESALYGRLDLLQDLIAAYKNTESKEFHRVIDRAFTHAFTNDQIPTMIFLLQNFSRSIHSETARCFSWAVTKVKEEQKPGSETEKLALTLLDKMGGKIPLKLLRKIDRTTKAIKMKIEEILSNNS